jgi:hypothetical protein
MKGNNKSCFKLFENEKLKLRYECSFFEIFTTRANPCQFESRYFLHNSIYTIEWINKKNVTAIERQFLLKFEDAKANRKTKQPDTKKKYETLEDACASSQKPIPHLPPYACQYR